MKGRNLKEAAFVFVSGFLAFMGCSIILFVLAFVFYNGLPAISIDFITLESKGFGSEGGILYQLIGTLWMVVGAAIVSLPLSLGTALYQTEFMPGKLNEVSSRMLFILNGIPSIVFGLFGYIFFCVFLGLGVSWVTGALILGIMIVPTITISIKEAIDDIPVSYRESGLALGFTKWKLIRKIVLPQSFHGVATGLLLGLSRAAGETAPIMFTATTFSGVTFPKSFSEPVTTLPTHIMVLAQESLNASAKTNAWGAALILVVIVFSMSLTSMLLRYGMEKRKGGEL